MSKIDYVLDVGGSIINGGILNAPFLNAFKKFIKEYVSQGVSFGIIVGGGKIARSYQEFLREHVSVDNTDLDMVGIRATKINAELVRILLKEWTYPQVFESPHEEIGKSNHQIIVFSGWKPGWSTDYVSVLVAERFGVREVLSLSNIKGVYALRDGQVQEGKLIEQLSWDEYERIVEDEWTPGMRVPFDPVATKEAKTKKFRVAILDGEDLENVRRYMKHEFFIGTVIS